MDGKTRFEVAIVGGGPAGLSAALLLGRCRRRVVMFDDGQYRNARSRRLNGFLGRDGAAPDALRAAAWEEIARYETVVRRRQTVAAARASAGGFALALDGGAEVWCRKLLLATGLVDEVPDVPGATELVGDGLYHCPYCDGWELRDQPLAVHDPGGELASLLTQWSRDLVLCTDGPGELDGAVRARLERRGVAIEARRITRLDRCNAGVRIAFADGASLERRAIFARLGHRPRSDLARQLGCDETPRHGVEVNRYEGTRVPGVYVAGDASRDVLMAIVAAGEGAAAAVAINAALDAEG